MFPHALRREIIALLCLKALLLFALYQLFFAHPAAADGHSVLTHLLATSSR